MQTICISLGGSVISREDGLNAEYIRELKKIIEKHKEKKFIIITGGGYANRRYVDLLRKEGANEFILDEIGIAFTKINALAVKSFFKGDDVYPEVVTNISELKKAYPNSRVIFGSGFMPGITTDAVAILCCEAVGAERLINVSKESGVYNKDPKEKGAKKFERMTYDELISLAEKSDTRTAKAQFIFDLVASKLAKRSKIRIDFIGSKIEELELALQGKKHSGTVVYG